MTRILTLTFFFGLLMHAGPVRAGDELEKAFANPPDSAKASCYWWWFNSLVDKEAITRDLEAFKAKGMGGVLLICSGNDYGVAPMPRGPAFLSPEWRELYKHAVQECARLDLELGVNFCGGGWCMGGSWIKPEYSSRWYVQSQVVVEGPGRFSERLPLAGHRDGYEPPYHGNVRHYMTWPEEKADYRDTAVVAFREADGGASDLGPERRRHLPAKSNRWDGGFNTSSAALQKETLSVWSAMPGDRPIRPEEVIDLTATLKPDGSLDWDVPAGRWTIQRIGHVVIGCDVRCVLPEVGYVLEVDWLSSDAVDEMFTHFGKILIEDAGPHVGTTFKYLHTDSFEDGFPNWTGRILDRFKQYRGYDPTPYLPVLAGKIVGSAEVSDRFLYDYRKTVADCMAHGNYGHFAKRSAEYGLEIQAEAGGPSWSGTMCMDALKNLGRCARPMGEFWMGYGLEVSRQTASASHIYGRRTASAESFTGGGHWNDSPASRKPIADRAFCDGVNRFLFHTMTCQRPQDGKPGYEYGAGTHFNPNVTWWDQAAGPWLSYVNRCQAMLQAGRFVADILYYYGDWAPNKVDPVKDPSLAGYDYDVCNVEVLLTRLSVKDGRLVLPDGMSYRYLVLPESKRMPVEVIKKIEELVTAGATVIGPRPQSDPGLKDYPHCDDVVRQTAARLWGDLDGQKVTIRQVGQGCVIWGKPLHEILQGDGVAPDFEVSPDEKANPLARAAWIWNAEDGANAPAATRFFKTEFDLPATHKIIAADVWITADNGFELKVNGTTVCRGDNWQRIYQANLAGRLHAGKNLLQLSAFNSLPGGAGLIARVEVQFHDGKTFSWSTRRQGWLSSRDGTDWAPPLEIGGYGCAPWGSRAAAVATIDFIHRATADAEFYFLVNRLSSRANVDAIFRVSGRQPELWDPVTGTQRDLPQFEQHDGRTTVPLQFEPHGSMFVVFRKKAEAGGPKPDGSAGKNFPALTRVMQLTGPWTVQFDKQWFYPVERLSGDGGQGALIFEKLEDWRDRPEAAVRYFSGTALYRKHFDCPASAVGRRLFVDLGSVKECARVKLNGQEFGVVWCAPRRVEITGVVKEQGNVLEIDVVNLWPNRLIGDAALPPERRRTKTNVTTYKKDSLLLPSGLLGPVVLQAAE